MLKLIELERVIATTPVTDVDCARGQLALLRGYVNALELIQLHAQQGAGVTAAVAAAGEESQQQQ